VKRISPHLSRGPDEAVDSAVREFYGRLLTILREPAFRHGDWHLLLPEGTWEGNWTHDCFVVFAWEGPNGKRFVVAVNFSPNQSQCHVHLPFDDLGGKLWRLRVVYGDASYEWKGEDLVGRGLFLDMSAWQAAVFSMQPSPKP
jgi:hypothetical protein